jgi:hypothetical protein
LRAEDLFNRFPREVFIPYTRSRKALRRAVYDREELKGLVELLNGVKPVYVSLYDSSFTIDKVFFDFDSEVDLSLAFDDVKAFVKRLEDHNYPFIPLFSGMKGFHVYVLMKPWTPPNLETAKAVLRDVQQSLAGDFTTCDRNVFGDVRRLVRYPNTINKTCYCVPLPLDFTSWDLCKIIDYAKSPRVVEYEVKDLPGIEAFVDDVVEYNHNERRLNPLHDFMDMPPSLQLVKPLLRPCVFETVTTDPSPPHVVRVALVTELMFYGWSKDSIHELIRRLRWADYDPKTTKYQLDQIFRKRYLPPSCYKLRPFVRCVDCGWVYFYNWKFEG